MKKIVLILMGIVSLGCCTNENVDISMPMLTEVDWSNTQSFVFLNDEWLENATVEFTDIPDTDSLMIVLSGVHPNERIEMEVATSRDDDGNIVFKGEQTEYIRSLQIEGIYKPRQSDAQVSTVSSVQVNIKYKVPSPILFRNYHVRFDGDSGFRHIRDYGTYPMATVDIEAQRDSCEFICGIINSELARNLQFLSLQFDYDGMMTMAYTTPELDEHKQTFRYWIRSEELTGKNIFEIENPALFYSFLFSAMSLTNDGENQPYMPQSDTAVIYLEASDDYRSSRIFILDDLHYKIFNYFNNSFSEKGLWETYDKRYIDLMYQRVCSVYSGPDNLVAYRTYRWCFANNY